MVAMVDKAVAVEAFVAATGVTFGMIIIGLLHDTPLPMLGKAISLTHLEDVKFYAPPLGAIAIGMFNAPSLPALYNAVVGTVASTAAAWCLVLSCGPDPVIYMRALVCGLAVFISKQAGALYPAAVALAVIFVDNAQMRSDLGIFYCLMPGLTGTAMLAVLATFKINLLHQLKPLLKKRDPKGELTQAFLPQGRVSFDFKGARQHFKGAVDKLSYVQSLEDVVTSLFVVFSVVVLGLLDTIAMPMLGQLISLTYLEDVKFYAPPLAAISVMTLAQAPPKLYNLVVSILSSTLCAWVLWTLLGPGPTTRALACGASLLVMKLSGAVFPPAGALAVLFVDNAKMQADLGVFYCLMPGLTGTAVLVMLATPKVMFVKEGYMKKLLQKKEAKKEPPTAAKKEPPTANVGEQRGRSIEKASSGMPRKRDVTPSNAEGKTSTAEQK
jgi:CBS-domain-containing membrane protein